MCMSEMVWIVVRSPLSMEMQMLAADSDLASEKLQMPSRMLTIEDLPGNWSASTAFLEAKLLCAGTQPTSYELRKRLCFIHGSYEGFKPPTKIWGNDSAEDMGGPIILGAGTLSTHPIPVTTVGHQPWRPVGTGRGEA